MGVDHPGNCQHTASIDDFNIFVFNRFRLLDRRNDLPLDQDIPVGKEFRLGFVKGQYGAIFNRRFLFAAQPLCINNQIYGS